MDKWVHFLAFGGTAFWWCASFNKFGWRQGFLIIVLSFLFGWIIELLQISGITVGRSYEYMDIVADGIGGIIGVVTFYLFERLLIQTNIH